MWRKLSIRIQLSILTSFLLLVVMVAAVSITGWLDFKQRQTLALELAKTVNKSLQHDMLKAYVSQNADEIADLSFRLSSFTSINEVLITNTEGQGVYEYKGSQQNFMPLIGKATMQPQFENDQLYIKHALEVDGYRYGFVTYIIDMEALSTQLDEQIKYYLIAFPVVLLLGFLIASRLSRKYSKPFEALTHAMENSDPANNKFERLQTDSENEIKKLYSGFDTLMTQIASTTEQMRYQSQHDQLTGLYNRFYIEEKILAALKTESNQGHVLINIDLDQFKIINDSAGFEAGDELLKMIARGCEGLLPDNAIMARLGGDDFLVLLTDSTEQAGVQFGEQRLSNLKDFRFIWEGQAYSISVSMGLVHFKANQYTLEELTKAVQSAFYSAKQSGRNKLVVYQPSDENSNSYNQEIVTATNIKEALDGGSARFELFAQDIVPLQESSDQFSYEILIRMWDSQGNFVPPDGFLPVAERYQMMAEIDAYVLWTYLETVTQHPEHIKNLHVAHVNLAGSSLNNPDFQQKVKEAVAHFDFPWHKLDLEITETSAVGNFNLAKDFIAWLQDKKIGLALDDFGTGMSSFEYLKSLPFDVVKIDGSFVKDMHNDPTDKAVIRYIQEIAQLRNQATIAEYVETEQDVIVLKEIGITYGQGYHLGKPKPLSEWL